MRQENGIVIDGETYSPSRFRRLRKDHKIELMWQWFHERYEDPANELPYVSREGGYQWINGGPYAANDLIQDMFSNVASLETMQVVIQRIEEDGYDWSPRRESEPDDSIYSINEPLPDISDFEFDDAEEPNRDVETLRREMHTRLNQLEELVRSTMPAHGGIGHNQPPESVDEELPDEVNLDELLEAVAEARQEGNSATPNLPKSEQVAGRFRRWAAAIGRWLADRTNAQLDNVVSVAMGGAIVLWAESLFAELMAAARAVSDWISALSFPF